MSNSMSLRETHHASHSYLLLNYLLLNYLTTYYLLLNYLLLTTYYLTTYYLLLNYLLLNYLLLNYSLLNYSLLNRIIFMQYFFILFSLAEACKPCVQAIQQDRRLLAYPPRVKLRETDVCTDIQLGQ